MCFKKIQFLKNSKIQNNQEQRQRAASSMNINEKLVSLNLIVQENKSDPLRTLYDEYNCKVIIYGYVMVN